MKNWIFFGFGVALGSGVTFFAVKKHYRDVAYHEISEMRAFYREKKAELEEKYASKSDKTDATDAKIDEKSNRYSEISDVLNRYSGGNQANFVVEPRKKVGKTGVKSGDFGRSNDEKDDLNDRFYTEEGDDPYDIFVSHEAPSEGYAEQPYRISEEQFASEKLHYDKVTVEYYADGIAVIDETDEILDSLEDQIGPDILGQPIEEDEIYVRNEARSTDYYIQLKETNFVSEEGSD